MNFEELLQAAADKGLKVMDWDFDSDRIHGLYCDKVIALSSKLPDSTAKACVLEEEIAHHDVTDGDIIAVEPVQNRRQEHRARVLAITRRVDLCQLAEALRQGYRSTQDIAERLNVTEEFLARSIEAYRHKHGLYVSVGNDILLLEPTVGLLSWYSQEQAEGEEGCDHGARLYRF